MPKTFLQSFLVDFTETVEMKCTLIDFCTELEGLTALSPILSFQEHLAETNIILTRTTSSLKFPLEVV